MPDRARLLSTTSDGWRGVLGDNLTFITLSRLADAIAEVALADSSSPSVFLGYDTRFMGRHLALALADSLSIGGVTTLLSRTPLATPILSWYLRNAPTPFTLGMMITASHNPPWYNGVKLRLADGGPPAGSVVNDINSVYRACRRQWSTRARAPLAYVEPDVRQEYVRALRAEIDLAEIDRTIPAIATDPMHGATSGLLPDLLAGTRVRIHEVRAALDPKFGGAAPEPTPASVTPLIDVVRSFDCWAGFAHDGDGDRIVGADAARGFVPAEDLALVLARQRVLDGVRGAIVGTAASTSRMRRAADLWGVPWRQVPTGFWHASDLMRTEEVLVASEQNGGIALGGHLPERDGILAAARLVDLMARRRMPLGALLDEVDAALPPVASLRKDYERQRFPPSYDFDHLLPKPPATLGGVRVRIIERSDGVKLTLEDESWVLVRAARTEPLIRLYAEAASVAEAEARITAVADKLLTPEVTRDGEAR